MLPIWSRTISAQVPSEETLANVQVPLVCGGVRVCPGDVILADDDGVCVVARSEAADVLAKARTREEKEEALRRRYAAGELGLDINTMRERLQEKGLRYVDANDL